MKNKMKRTESKKEEKKFNERKSRRICVKKQGEKKRKSKEKNF